MVSCETNVTAVVLAAGEGSRMHSDVTKQRITLFGESVLHRSVRAFAESRSVSSIIVT